MDYSGIAASGPRNDSLLRASKQIDTPPVNPTYRQNRNIDLPTTTLQQRSIQST